ncbi:hypothetical protein ACTXT7_002182 [Hymenolepis weldensis]
MRRRQRRACCISIDLGDIQEAACPLLSTSSWQRFLLSLIHLTDTDSLFEMFEFNLKKVEKSYGDLKGNYRKEYPIIERICATASYHPKNLPNIFITNE